MISDAIYVLVFGVNNRHLLSRGLSGINFVGSRLIYSEYNEWGKDLDLGLNG